MDMMTRVARVVISEIALTILHDASLRASSETEGKQANRGACLDKNQEFS